MLKRKVKRGLFVAMVLLGAGLLFGAAGQAERAAVGVPTTSAQVRAAATQSHAGGGGMMKWGVLLYGVGEVGGTIGMGLAAIRGEKRREAARARTAGERPRLLWYEERKPAQRAPEAGLETAA